MEGLINFLPSLASNCDPHELCFLSSWDYIIITVLMDSATIEYLWRDIQDTDNGGFL
jgi:hypothetical protein